MKKRHEMKMAELPVFVRVVAIGFVGAEIWRISSFLGSRLAGTLTALDPEPRLGLSLAGVLLCLLYGAARGGYGLAWRLIRSLRADLLLTVGVGIWANTLLLPLLVKFHKPIRAADPQWAIAVLILLCLILLSPLVQTYLRRTRKRTPQIGFLEDEEIADAVQDRLSNVEHAKHFANAVLESGATPGLVFGIDGPWGVGKTSFVNLAERYWNKAQDRVIVCRFEPLRYATDTNITERLIRELSSAIQRIVFSPEFRPTATRYSRLVRGKAEISFLGFKLSLEPGQDTVEDLLDEIDEVLRRTGRRVIIVLDDLDRLDPKTVNSLLFATRRAFKLTQATYVLCYDTEMLVEGKEDGLKAREFLEKFVTIKLSLLVDSASVRDFLRQDWQRTEGKFSTIPSDTMLKLSGVLDQLADLLDSDLAPRYMPLIGDLRKVKRFVNAMLMMQLEKSDLGRSDFDNRDLINLILLHLNYPGIFRQIYAEETGGRTGTFSVSRNHDAREFINAEGFADFVKEQKGDARFLLEQLFNVNTLRIRHLNEEDEATLSSRACFNLQKRNLEDYLKLIVRFKVPEPRETFALYQKAVDGIIHGGKKVDAILDSPEFELSGGDAAHDQFWRVLTNRASELNARSAEDAIRTLVDYLPHYSSVDNFDRGLRQRSIYSLLRLLDRAGWSNPAQRRTRGQDLRVLEIAGRIFGDAKLERPGLVDRLASPARGVLGWNDLMLFRLQCSADRRGQLHNLHAALILRQDSDAPTTGDLRQLSLMGMRELSQHIFGLFRTTYIDQRRNFFSEVDDTPASDFLGIAPTPDEPSDTKSNRPTRTAPQRVVIARNILKSFVIYQLSNLFPPAGSGVGCGYYDETGPANQHGIAEAMNRYVFDFCFNPEVDPDNAFHFLDYCLTHLTNPAFSDEEREGYFASKVELVGGFDALKMGLYWNKHQAVILSKAADSRRLVLTSSYDASYHDDLPDVFLILDQLAKEALALQDKYGVAHDMKLP